MDTRKQAVEEYLMTAHGLANGTYRIVDPVPPRRILSGLVSCVRVRVRVRVRVHVHVCVYMGVCVCVCVCVVLMVSSARKERAGPKPHSLSLTDAMPTLGSWILGESSAGLTLVIENV